MEDIDKLKFRFGQKYQLPESSIDDSLLPLFIATENLEKQFAETLSEMTNSNRELADKINVNQKSIHYDNPKTAFYGNLSIFAVPIIIISLTISILWWGWIFKENNTTKTENLERLSKIIEVKDSVYFVPKEKYKVTKKGVILIEHSLPER